jgi:hypothetical protein|tara:strand:- start:2968 stop:3183 length:216 start_codon:yes stop_codon:yes gene_type:complete
MQVSSLNRLAFSTRFDSRWHTPFGRLVVPDVKNITEALSGAVAGTGIKGVMPIGKSSSLEIRALGTTIWEM